MNNIYTSQIKELGIKCHHPTQSNSLTLGQSIVLNVGTEVDKEKGEYQLGIRREVGKEA